MTFYLCSLCPFLLFFSCVVYLLKILIPSSLPLLKLLISWVPCGLCSLSGYKLQSWFLRFLLFFTLSLFPLFLFFFFCPVYSDNCFSCLEPFLKCLGSFAIFSSFKSEGPKKLIGKGFVTSVCLLLTDFLPLGLDFSFLWSAVWVSYHLLIFCYCFLSCSALVSLCIIFPLL